LIGYEHHWSADLTELSIVNG